MKKRILGLFLLCISLNVFSDAPKHCEKFAAPLSGGFCIHYPESGASSNVLYYLHGKNGSEHTWSDQDFYTQQIRDYWEQQWIAPPVVISISLGPIWLLAEKNDSQYSGLFEAMVYQLIPMIEQNLPFQVQQRTVLGDSMGGFNGIQLSLKTDLFYKAALLCTPMAGISPFSEEQAIQTYIEQTGAWAYYKTFSPETVIKAVKESITISRVFFPDETAWETANPLTLPQQELGSTKKRFYISIGYYDEFAAYETNQLFVSALRQQGMRAKWRPTWGGHCAIDIPSLARFLVL